MSYRAVLVICRSAARPSRRKLGKRTDLPESTICNWEVGQPHGVRQLLQFAGSVQVPCPALLPVILGQPQAFSDLTVGLAAAPATGDADRG